MNKIIYLLLVVSQFCFSQVEDAWIYFRDKPSSASYLNNPLTMLTQRALDRRTTQSISLDISDVPVEQTYIDAIENSTGIDVKAKSKWLNCVHVQGLLVDIQALIVLTFVDHIEYANHALNARMSHQNSNSIAKNYEVQMTYNYGSSNNQVEMLKVNSLHQGDFLGQGKIISVLDSGFIGVDVASCFSNLITNNQILGGYNFPDRNLSYFSRHSHGTKVLSCMGSVVPGQLIGTAPQANYYLFITEDVNSETPLEESYWVEAAELADYYGTDVINSSLGYFSYDKASYSYQMTDLTGSKAFASRGANIAFTKGIVVVCSAGNSGTTTTPYVGVPAEANNVIAVGAVDESENYASFSSIGPTFPRSIKPDLMAKGSGCTVGNTDGSIGFSSGTSFASPILAGGITSFWSRFPHLKATEVVQLVKQSADLYNTPNLQKGYGIPDFEYASSIYLLNNPNFNFTSINNVFPNPVINSLKITSSSTENKSFHLYNEIGQLIFEKEFIELLSIDVSTFNKGIYFYKIIGNQTELGKIIKN